MKNNTVNITLVLSILIAIVLVIAIIFTAVNSSTNQDDSSNDVNNSYNYDNNATQEDDYDDLNVEVTTINQEVEDTSSNEVEVTQMIEETYFETESSEVNGIVSISDENNNVYIDAGNDANINVEINGSQITLETPLQSDTIVDTDIQNGNNVYIGDVGNANVDIQIN